MADTTITFAGLTDGVHRDIHAGLFAVVGGPYTYAATLSASQVYLAIPIPDRVTIMDGYVFSDHNTSYSFLAIVGWPDAKSLFMASTTIPSSLKTPFGKGLPHTVTLTDSDTFPRMKPLTVTIKTAASGTLNGAMTVVAFLQRN